MKYIVIETDDGQIRRLPFVFPEFLNHVDVADSVLPTFGGQAVGAGFTDVVVSMVFGGSESMGLTAQPEDLWVLRYSNSTSGLYSPTLMAHLAELEAQQREVTAHNVAPTVASEEPAVNSDALVQITNKIDLLTEAISGFLDSLVEIEENKCCSSGTCGGHRPVQAVEEDEDDVEEEPVPVAETNMTLELSKVSHKKVFVPPPRKPIPRKL